MTIFEELVFKSKPHFGKFARIFFDNGYGASVITGGYSYANPGEYELAVLKGNEKNFELCYDTPITNDVIGWQSPEEITILLNEIKNLPPAA